jgi:hypothetical protein
MLIGDSSYPAYLDPTFDEMVHLADSRWDTLRVLEWEEGILIASGYGNTHETLVYKWRSHYNITRKYGGLPCWDPLIFFHDNRHDGPMLANMEDISGPRRAMPRQWMAMLHDRNVPFLVEIARLSGLTLV